MCTTNRTDELLRRWDMYNICRKEEGKPVNITVTQADAIAPEKPPVSRKVLVQKVELSKESELTEYCGVR